MPKTNFKSTFSDLIIEINNDGVSILGGHSHKYVAKKRIIENKWNNIKITQMLDGLEITISGMVKTSAEFELILSSFIEAIKSLRFKLSNLGAIFPASNQ